MPWMCLYTPSPVQTSTGRDFLVTPRQTLELSSAPRSNIDPCAKEGEELSERKTTSGFSRTLLISKKHQSVEVMGTAAVY